MPFAPDPALAPGVDTIEPPLPLVDKAAPPVMVAWPPLPVAPAPDAPPVMLATAPAPVPWPVCVPLLPPRAQPYTEAEVDTAIGSVHAALEICASRYVDHSSLPFPELLADGVVNNGLWLGPELGGPDVSAFELTWQVAGEPAQTAEARHPNGDPRTPLYWLANFLSERGIGLLAGQAVITGSYAGVLTLPLGKRTQFDYAGLARFEVEFRNP